MLTKIFGIAVAMAMGVAMLAIGSNIPAAPERAAGAERVAGTTMATATLEMDRATGQTAANQRPR